MAPPWFPGVPGPTDEPDLDLLELLGEVLALLGERRRDVLDRRLGLTTGAAATLQEIGDGYGVARERVRQLEASAIDRVQWRSTERAAAPKDHRHCS